MSSSTYRNSLEEAEALDVLDPLRHLLAADEPSAVVPDQIESIINQHVTIRYYTDLARQPITFSSDPPPHEDACYDIVLKLDMTEGCGGKIWPAAEVLGAYIAGKYTDKWKGKTVVELGSGTGLVGFLVAKMGMGAKVWVTDQIPMLGLMKENLALNEVKDECIVEELNWGEPLPTTVPSQPDVLLLADCVYLEVAFQPLVDTLTELSTASTIILFCYQKRRKADKRFFNLLRKRFTFADVADDDAERAVRYRREGTQLLRLHKK